MKKHKKRSLKGKGLHAPNVHSSLELLFFGRFVVVLVVRVLSFSFILSKTERYAIWVMPFNM